jgi:hypothetical protein
MGLCRVFGPGVLPGQVLAEPATVLRLVQVYQAGHREDDEEGGEA